jgi:hypothetical protein
MAQKGKIARERPWTDTQAEKVTCNSLNPCPIHYPQSFLASAIAPAFNFTSALGTLFRALCTLLLANMFAIYYLHAGIPILERVTTEN